MARSAGIKSSSGSATKASSPKQKKIVERVMHEFKHGELDKRDGAPVSNRRQAVAIALHEAGASNEESPAKNKENLRKTEARERSGKATKPRGGEEPAKRVRDRDVPGCALCRGEAPRSPGPFQDEQVPVAARARRLMSGRCPGDAADREDAALRPRLSVRYSPERSDVQPL